MFGGLYGDLPDARDSGDAAAKAGAQSSSSSGWGAPQLRVPAKRPAPAMPPSVLRAGGWIITMPSSSQAILVRAHATVEPWHMQNLGCILGL